MSDIWPWLMMAAFVIYLIVLQTEIKRLKVALKKIVGASKDGKVFVMTEIARAALEGK